MVKEFQPQPEDYFVLDSIAFAGSPPSQIKPAVFNPLTVPTNTVYYTTVADGVFQNLGYTYLFYNGIPYPNPITISLPAGSYASPYVGAFAINGLDIKIDSVTITNNYSSDIIVDFLKANPANTNINGQQTIPPSKIARYSVPAGETMTLSDEFPVTLKNQTAQTVTLPFYMFGEGLAIAFPNSVTGTTTFTANYGVQNVAVNATVYYTE